MSACPAALFGRARLAPPPRGPYARLRSIGTSAHADWGEGVTRLLQRDDWLLPSAAVQVRSSGAPPHKLLALLPARRLLLLLLDILLVGPDSQVLCRASITPSLPPAHRCWPPSRGLTQLTDIRLPAASPSSFTLIRDDLTHPLLGGNKFRKLDGLWGSLVQVRKGGAGRCAALQLGEGRAGGRRRRSCSCSVAPPRVMRVPVTSHDTPLHSAPPNNSPPNAQASDIVTCGGLQSTHTLAVAAAAADHGKRAHLLVRGERPAVPTGTHLYARMLAHRVEYVSRTGGWVSWGSSADTAFGWLGPACYFCRAACMPAACAAHCPLYLALLYSCLTLSS